MPNIVHEPMLDGLHFVVILGRTVQGTVVLQAGPDVGDKVTRSVKWVVVEVLNGVLIQPLGLN